ncbi:hypothetical protein CDAR_236721 [Caerostris darwini]|uniref:Uncharacterized protein n=1 Tax=Caerostris darwini TaxID=1538125 RepID=A0AAV4QRN1_9ARAC|nr:hypothetical protein CDAR_236721 [Caerostris darwini]
MFNCNLCILQRLYFEYEVKKLSDNTKMPNPVLSSCGSKNQISHDIHFHQLRDYLPRWTPISINSSQCTSRPTTFNYSPANMRASFPPEVNCVPERERQSSNLNHCPSSSNILNLSF